MRHVYSPQNNLHDRDRQEKYKEENEEEKRECKFSFKSSFKGDVQKGPLGAVGYGHIPLAQSMPVNLMDLLAVEKAW